MGMYLVTAWADNGQAFRIIVDPAFNRNNAISLAKKYLEEDDIPFELKDFSAAKFGKNEWYSSEGFELQDPEDD